MTTSLMITVFNEEKTIDKLLEAMAAKRLVFATYDNPLKEDYLRMAPFAKWIVIEPTAEALYNRLVYYTQHPGEMGIKVKLLRKSYVGRAL